MLAEDTEVRLHLGKLSCARSVELVREAKQRGLKGNRRCRLGEPDVYRACIEDFDSRFHVRPLFAGNRTARRFACWFAGWRH